MQLENAGRIALAAQGFTDATPAKVDRRHFKRALSRMGVLQLDSVQYLCRSHYLPIFSRLGAYSMGKLDDYCHRGSQLLECWAHEASLVPMHMEPLLRWRKQEAQEGSVWKHLHQNALEQPRLIAQVLAEVQERGPLRASELAGHEVAKGDWWGGQSSAKLALEWLFRIGALGARRDHRFQRVYHSWDQLVPFEVRGQEAPPKEEAQRELIMIAAKAHGIGTADCLGDYFRLRKVDTRLRLAELVEDKRLREVEVESVDEVVYLHPRARCPRQVPACTILSPFDPVVWNRRRAAWLFGFEYRIEIYLPKAKRKYGYYVLPYLCDGKIVGRLELKAERALASLLVVGAWCEQGANRENVAVCMTQSLRRLADHFEFETIKAPRKGNLARELSSSLAAARSGGER